jgi:hypothetical protein
MCFVPVAVGLLSYGYIFSSDTSDYITRILCPGTIGARGNQIA